MPTRVGRLLSAGAVSVSAANAKLNEFKYDKDELAKKMQATSAMTSKFIREFFKSPKNKEEPVEL